MVASRWPLALHQGLPQGETEAYILVREDFQTRRHEAIELRGSG